MMTVRAIPNWISVFRALLALPIALLFSRHPLWGLLLFIFAASLDWADGVLARKLDAKSELGATLDPLADKILYLVSLITVCTALNSAPLVTVIALTLPAEILLMVVRLPQIKKNLGGSAAATWVGKIKMCIQCAAILLLMSSIVVASPATAALGTIFAFIGIGFSWWSLFSHIARIQKITPPSV